MVNFLRDVMILVAILATLVALIVYPSQESVSHAGVQASPAHAQSTPAASPRSGDVSASSFEQRAR